MAGVMTLNPITSDFLTEKQLTCNELVYHENHIRKDLSKIKECFVYIGYHLCDIRDNRLYESVYHQGIHDYCRNIFQYAEQELDLCKSTVYQLMAVCENFSPKEMRTGLKPEYRDYSFSQLVELLNVPSAFHQYCDPHMPVRKIREWKLGKPVSLAFGMSDGVESCSSRCGLSKKFQIPRNLLAINLISGNLKGYKSYDSLTLEQLDYNSEGKEEPFQTSGMASKEIESSSTLGLSVLGDVKVEIRDESSSKDEFLLTEKAVTIAEENESLTSMLNLISECWSSLCGLYKEFPNSTLQFVINSILKLERELSVYLNYEVKHNE